MRKRIQWLVGFNFDVPAYVLWGRLVCVHVIHTLAIGWQFIERENFLYFPILFTWMHSISISFDQMLHTLAYTHTHTLKPEAKENSNFSSFYLKTSTVWNTTLFHQDERLPAYGVCHCTRIQHCWATFIQPQLFSWLLSMLPVTVNAFYWSEACSQSKAHSIRKEIMWSAHTHTHSNTRTT